MATEKRRIMVIDDEAGFTSLLKLNLEKTGRYEVHSENNGARSLESAREFQPELVLLDVVMPGADGGDVLTRFKADERLKQVPVIFLTATMSPDAVAARGGVIGGIPVIAKPVDVKKLVRQIDAALNP